MNIYNALNQMIEYIEINLENEIEYIKLARILGVNENTMKSIFNLMCNMTLSTYIRNRRLSNAGFDLCTNNAKIVDIATKYQYENPTSFSRAFEKFHGIKPSTVKKSPSGLKIFPKIVFNEEIEEYDTSIEYSIIERNEMVLYGKGKKTNHKHISKDAPEFWEEMNNKYQNANIKFGMTVYKERFHSDDYEYWILYDEKVEGFEKYIISKNKWLKFVVHSQNAKDIQEMTNKFYYKVYPVLKYKVKRMPELEYYHDNITEIWIPIEN